MNPLFRWLLGLDTIPADAEGLQLVWERPFAAWVWLLLVAIAAALAAWAYTRILGAARGRAALAVARFGLVILILVLISGPALQLPRESIEPDWVVVLADRSASLSIADAPGAGRPTRDAQLRAILEESAPMWRGLDEKREVVWLGFHDAAFNLVESPDPLGAPVLLDEPLGVQTRLDAALEQALQRAAARSLSGIVILSDGRTTQTPSRTTIRRLRADRVGVYVVPLGSSDSPGDLAIRRVDAPSRAFVRDQVPVTVALDRLAAASGLDGAVVKLIDELTGETLDSVELDAVDETAQVTLTAEPELEGEATWKVVVETAEPDLVAENNEKTLLIELIDRPLRVLYVDGYPRWEYRYLKNMLIREKSIDSSVMLISADRDFAQEGNLPITRLPRSPEEFAPFDVLILGDVPGGFFSPEQLEMIREHVAMRGAGLLWIGGERYTPRSYTGNALADLLPMRGSLALGAIDVPVSMQPTDLARRMGILRLDDDSVHGWPDELVDPEAGWSSLYWAQRIEPGRLKPTAEVLARTTASFRGTPLPLVLHMRYGSGQTMYVATDEIWRWRYGRGERLPERFWVQIIRRLGRETLAAGGETARLEVSPRRLVTGQAMRVELQLLDAALVEQARVSVAAVLETADGSPVAELELRRLDPNGELPGAGPATYAATYLPGVAGALVLRITDPALPDVRLQVPVDVFTPDDELRRPETDHPLLASLAAETGGRVLAPDEISGLPQMLPNRSVRTISPLTESIWDTPLALALIVLVLTLEWVGRKLVRLV